MPLFCKQTCRELSEGAKFLIKGVKYEFLGYVHVAETYPGASVWHQAKAIAAQTYGVSQECIRAVGVILPSGQTLGEAESSTMSTQQVCYHVLLV